MDLCTDFIIWVKVKVQLSCCNQPWETNCFLLNKNISSLLVALVQEGIKPVLVGGRGKEISSLPHSVQP